MSNSKGKPFSSKDTSSIVDGATKTLLFKVLHYLQNSPILSFAFDLKVFEVTGAVTNSPFPHSLGYAPKDIILTSKTGTANVTINYDLTDSTYIYITTSAATTIRLLVGSYRSEA